MNKPPAIELHLRIRVEADKREAFLAFLRDAIPVYEAPGGIRVDLLEDKNDPTRFIERIAYETVAAYEEDDHRVQTDPTSIALIERWRALLAEPPVIEVYRSATPNSHTAEIVPPIE